MSQAPIPNTAPFNEDEIAILNRVVGPASPTQRAWLAGFLAGIDAAGGAAAHVPAPAPKAVEPITILFATESGNSEKLANDMGKLARKRGFKPNIVDFADVELAKLGEVKKLVVIAATWGEGDPPSRATHAYEALMNDATAPRLDGVEFGVLALGDSAYVDFCGVGRKLDERLEALGAKRVVDRVDCDLDFEQPARSWVEGALDVLAPPQADAGGHVISVDFGARQAPVETGPVVAEVIDHVNLNSSRSDKETVHLALAFEGHYEPGDALDVYAENDPALVDEVLKAAGHAGNETLRDEFTTARDITTLSLKTLETFANATGNKEVRNLIDAGHAREWIAGRQLIDLLEAHPSKLDIEQLTALTRPLAPRAYSIASSRREVEDEVHILVSAVRYESHGRKRKGVASSYIADRLKKGAGLKVKVKANKHFRLPEADRDIIMVGPGTGVAPFRAFVQERRALEANGRSWLFFGDRRFTHDFLYQTEWLDALEDGSLTRMDVAFSRDAPEKVYVQNKLWEKRRDLVEWLDGGAHFYVCGDASAMAKDVRAALVRSFADVKSLSDEAAEQAVRALESEKRYLTDVY